jgi:hypothetical protein
VRLQLTATAPTAACPRGAGPSSSIHRRDQRHPTDLPWGASVVWIQLMVRTFVGRNTSSTRRIFTERRPDLLATYARKTHRLITALRAIGVAVGTQARGRLATCLRLPARAATSLRLIRAAPISPAPALHAVGSMSGPGGGAIATARSSSLSRITASWTCCRSARRRWWRPGWPGIRRSPSFAGIGVTSTWMAFAGGYPTRCRWWIAFISSGISAQPLKPSSSPNDPRCRRRPFARPRPSRRRSPLSPSRRCLLGSARVPRPANSHEQWRSRVVMPRGPRAMRRSRRCLRKGPASPPWRGSSASAVPSSRPIYGGARCPLHAAPDDLGRCCGRICPP